MALDAKRMAVEIRKALLKGKDVDKSVRDQIDESWFTICKAIVKHIQNNSEVQINFPVAPNAGTISFDPEGGLITEGSYSYVSKVQ